MTKPPKIDLNAVIAINLDGFMRDYMDGQGISQNALAKLSGVPQTTIGLLLNPQKRERRKSGKMPSPTVGQLQQLAEALNVDAWAFLRAMTPNERRAYKKMDEAVKLLRTREPSPQ